MRWIRVSCGSLSLIVLWVSAVFVVSGRPIWAANYVEPSRLGKMHVLHDTTIGFFSPIVRRVATGVAGINAYRQDGEGPQGTGYKVHSGRTVAADLWLSVRHYLMLDVTQGHPFRTVVSVHSPPKPADHLTGKIALLTHLGADLALIRTPPYPDAERLQFDAAHHSTHFGQAGYSVAWPNFRYIAARDQRKPGFADTFLAMPADAAGRAMFLQQLLHARFLKTVQGGREVAGKLVTVHDAENRGPPIDLLKINMLGIPSVSGAPFFGPTNRVAGTILRGNVTEEGDLISGSVPYPVAYLLPTAQMFEALSAELKSNAPTIPIADEDRALIEEFLADHSKP